MVQCLWSVDIDQIKAQKGLLLIYLFLTNQFWLGNDLQTYNKIKSILFFDYLLFATAKGNFNNTSQLSVVILCLQKVSRKLRLSKTKNTKFNDSGILLPFYFFFAAWGADIIVKVKYAAKIWARVIYDLKIRYLCQGFIKGWAQGKLTSCEDGFACLVWPCRGKIFS